MAGLGAMFGPQLLAATKEKLIITDWLHFEFAGELQPSTVTVLQQMISREIKEYLTLHPTHKLVTITNQWASEIGKRIALTPEQIRDWRHFYEIQDAAINYQETAHIEYAAERGDLS
jgi:hypothetical protein